MLSSEALAEIVTAFGGNGSEIDPIHKNRRAHRVQHNGRTMIFRAGENISETAVSVQMRDISARGCSFVCKPKLATGSNFVIQFPEWLSAQWRTLRPWFTAEQSPAVLFASAQNSPARWHHRGLEGGQRF